MHALANVRVGFRSAQSRHQRRVMILRGWVQFIPTTGWAKNVAHNGLLRWRVSCEWVMDEAEIWRSEIALTLSNHSHESWAVHGWLARSSISIRFSCVLKPTWNLISFHLYAILLTSSHCKCYASFPGLYAAHSLMWSSKQVLILIS